MAKIVLTFADGLFAKVDSILRAVVVAGHAAYAVVLPLGSAITELYVVNRTTLRAYAATHAAVEHTEGTVGDEAFLEEETYGVRL